MFIILKDGCIHVTEGATVAPRKQYPDVETAIPFHDFFQKKKSMLACFSFAYPWVHTLVHRHQCYLCVSCSGIILKGFSLTLIYSGSFEAAVNWKETSSAPLKPPLSNPKQTITRHAVQIAQHHSLFHNAAVWNLTSFRQLNKLKEHRPQACFPRMILCRTLSPYLMSKEEPLLPTILLDKVQPSSWGAQTQPPPWHGDARALQEKSPQCRTWARAKSGAFCFYDSSIFKESTACQLCRLLTERCQHSRQGIKMVFLETESNSKRQERAKVVVFLPYKDMTEHTHGAAFCLHFLISCSTHTREHAHTERQRLELN